MVEEMEGDNFELACLIRNQLWQHGIAWVSGTGLADLPEALQQLAMEVGDRPSFSDYLQAQGLMGAAGALDDDEDDEDDDEDDEDDEEDEDDVPALTTDAANA